ncbi:MAG: nucleoside-diphosphate kinase [Patescibacteria group bacterium]|nr:nucleoside-diphosphate kinase [Patescibacteria group bacterium]
MQQTLVIIKPDGVNRGIIGEIIHRFERKGLKIVGMKMEHLSDTKLDIHYEHHKGKPFFERLKKYMKSAPTILLVLEGNNVVEVVRHMAGPTRGYEALPGTIRGDYSLSQSNNIVHASDSVESAEKEIKRFFKSDELFSYKKIDWEMIYAEEERE